MKKIIFIIALGSFIIASSTIFITAQNKPDIARKIIFQKTLDLDGDKKSEKIVFDVEKSFDGQDPYVYSRVSIYEIKNNKDILAFRKEIYGWDYGKNGLFKLADLNKDKIPEIYLSEFHNGSSPDQIDIIEKLNNKFLLVFQSPIDEVLYKDFDNDGILEIYGLTGPTTGGPWYDRNEVIFKFYKDKYYPSYKFTKAIYLERLKEAEQKYQSNPNFDNFDRLKTLYAYNGLKEKGVNLIKKYTPDNNEGSIEDFVNYIEIANKYFWGKIKKQSRD